MIENARIEFPWGLINIRPSILQIHLTINCVNRDYIHRLISVIIIDDTHIYIGTMSWNNLTCIKIVRLMISIYAFVIKLSAWKQSCNLNRVDMINIT